jgi:ribose transport system substrate-binding protein
MARTRLALQLAAAVSAAALLAACSVESAGSTGSSGSGGSTPNGTSSGSGSTSGKQIVIGISNQTMAVTFPVGLAKGAQEEANKLGVKLIVLDSKGDVQKQGSDIQDLVAEKVNGS